MRFKKHWPWLAAILLWAAPIWNFLIWLLDLRSRIDALAGTYREVGGAHAIAGYILNPPPWLNLPAIFFGVVLIWWDLRRNQNRQETERFNVQQAEIKTATEKEKYEAVAKWLKSVISKREYCVHQAFLFGSIVHEHYPTSDVDLIVQFTTLRDSKLSSIVQKLKGGIARDFKATFQHELHVTFFCSNETNQQDRFLRKAGNYQRII